MKRLAPPLIVTFVLLTGSSLPSAATLPPIPDLASFHWQALSTPHRDRLRQAYKKALASPDDGTAVGQLGIVLQAFEEFQLAATCFERSSQLEPRAFRWIYYLGIVEAAQGEKSKALDAFARAVQMSPAYLPARLKLADAWLATGNLEESQRAYGRAMRQFPDSAPAYYGVARIQASNKQYDAAITNLNKACALFPDYGAAYYSLGIIYRDQGKLADAQKSLAMFELHRNSSPRVPDPLLDAVDEIKAGANEDLSRGLQLLDEGHPDRAVREFERALQKNPELAQAHANLLSAYLALGDLNRAEEQYRAAIKLDPSLYESYYNYGLLLMKRGDEGEAENAFRKALEINPFYAEAHNDLAFVLAREGKIDEAARHFELAIDDSPNFRDAHFNLGQIELTQGRTRDAIDHLLKAVAKKDEQTPACMLWLARAYQQEGDRPKALQYASQARVDATSFGQTALLAEIKQLEKQLKQVDH